MRLSSLSSTSRTVFFPFAVIGSAKVDREEEEWTTASGSRTDSNSLQFGRLSRKFLTTRPRRALTDVIRRPCFARQTRVRSRSRPRPDRRDRRTWRPARPAPWPSRSAPRRRSRRSPRASLLGLAVGAGRRAARSRRSPARTRATRSRDRGRRLARRGHDAWDDLRDELRGRRRGDRRDDGRASPTTRLQVLAQLLQPARRFLLVLRVVEVRRPALARSTRTARSPCPSCRDRRRPRRDRGGA